MQKAARKRSEKRLKRWSWTGRNSFNRAVTRAGRALTCSGRVQLGGRGDCRGVHNTAKHNQSFANNPLATTLQSTIAIYPFLMSLYLFSVSARFFDVFLRFLSAVVATSDPGSLLYASTRLKKEIHPVVQKATSILPITIIIPNASLDHLARHVTPRAGPSARPARTAEMLFAPVASSDLSAVATNQHGTHLLHEPIKLPRVVQPFYQR